MSPTPVGVIFNSERMAPIKPAEIPKRRPTKIIGEAEGRIIFRMISFLVPRKDLPISMIEAEVLRTAPLVFKTMTGIAMMQTTNTFDVKPIP